MPGSTEFKRLKIKGIRFTLTNRTLPIFSKKVGRMGAYISMVVIPAKSRERRKLLKALVLIPIFQEIHFSPIIKSNEEKNWEIETAIMKTCE